MNGRDPEGKPISQGYSVTSFDKDGPATGSETWDTVALNRIDPNTVDALLQKNGKVVQSSSLMVSNDVKTLTINAPGTNEQGQNTGA